MKPLFAVLLLALAPAALAGATETVRIELTHLTAGKQWRAAYRLAAPAERLEFLRRFDQRRHLGWRPEDPAFEIVTAGEGEALRRRDGAPFDRVALTFRSDRGGIVRDYPLNAAFTDGSEWLYTGHLYALPVRGGAPPAVRPGFELLLQPATGEATVLDGRRRQGAVRWRDPDPDSSGTFVYFGFLEPLHGAGLPAVIDPGLPPYLRTAFEDYVPRVGALYRERLGDVLRATPTLFISWNPQSASDGKGGDVLPGAIAFKFAGEHWREHRREHVTDAAALIAHELAHLWNGQRYRSRESEREPWVHEGGADALSWVAMQELGLIDAAGLAARLESAVNGCAGIRGLRGETLQAAMQARKFTLAYSCGAVLNLMVGRANAKQGGLFGFWRALFAQAAAADDRYDGADWIARVERSMSAPLARFVESVWSGPAVPGPDDFAAQLRGLGYAVSTGEPPLHAQSHYAADALAALMAADCKGATNFWYGPDGFVVGGLPQCGVLTAEEAAVTALAGTPLTQGIAAHAAVRKACGVASAKRAVTVTLSGGSALELACPARPIAAAPAWIAVSDP